MSTYGIKETKELLDFGFKLQSAITRSHEDGKFSPILDTPKFLPALLAAPRAFAGANLIPAELADLDDAEREELMAFVRERFELADRELEILIEDTLDLMLDLYRIANRYASLRRK
jgi:hypothetical protein